jgi:hypothetical protein
LRTASSTRIDHVVGVHVDAATAGFIPFGAVDPDRQLTNVMLYFRRYAERSSNIVHWSEFDRGGHFAAMEAPDLLVGDMRMFFRQLR